MVEQVATPIFKGLLRATVSQGAAVVGESRMKTPVIMLSMAAVAAVAERQQARTLAGMAVPLCMVQAAVAGLEPRLLVGQTEVLGEVTRQAVAARVVQPLARTVEITCSAVAMEVAGEVVQVAATVEMVVCQVAVEVAAGLRTPE